MCNVPVGSYRKGSGYFVSCLDRHSVRRACYQFEHIEGDVAHLGKGLGPCLTTEQASGAHSRDAAHQYEQAQLAAQALPCR